MVRRSLFFFNNSVTDDLECRPGCAALVNRSGAVATGFGFALEFLFCTAGGTKLGAIGHLGAALSTFIHF